MGFFRTAKTVVVTTSKWTKKNSILTISHNDARRFRMMASQEVYRRLLCGWLLTNSNCELCEAPLMQSVEGRTECVFCFRSPGWESPRIALDYHPRNVNTYYEPEFQSWPTNHSRLDRTNLPSAHLGGPQGPQHFRSPSSSKATRYLEIPDDVDLDDDMAVLKFLAEARKRKSSKNSYFQSTDTAPTMSMSRDSLPSPAQERNDALENWSYPTEMSQAGLERRPTNTYQSGIESHRWRDGLRGHQYPLRAFEDLNTNFDTGDTQDEVKPDPAGITGDSMTLQVSTSSSLPTPVEISREGSPPPTYFDTPNSKREGSGLRDQTLSSSNHPRGSIERSVRAHSASASIGRFGQVLEFKRFSSPSRRKPPTIDTGTPQPALDFLGGGNFLSSTHMDPSMTADTTSRPHRRLISRDMALSHDPTHRIGGGSPTKFGRHKDRSPAILDGEGGFVFEMVRDQETDSEPRSATSSPRKIRGSQPLSPSSFSHNKESWYEETDDMVKQFEKELSPMPPDDPVYEGGVDMDMSRHGKENGGTEGNESEQEEAGVCKSCSQVRRKDPASEGYVCGNPGCALFMISEENIGIFFDPSGDFSSDHFLPGENPESYKVDQEVQPSFLAEYQAAESPRFGRWGERGSNNDHTGFMVEPTLDDGGSLSSSKSRRSAASVLSVTSDTFEVLPVGMNQAKENLLAPPTSDKSLKENMDMAELMERLASAAVAIKDLERSVQEAEESNVGASISTR